MSTAWASTQLADRRQRLLCHDLLVVAEEQTKPVMTLLQMPRAQRTPLLKEMLVQWSRLALLWIVQSASHDAYRLAYLAEQPNRHQLELTHRRTLAKAILALHCLIQDSDTPPLQPLLDLMEADMPIKLGLSQQDRIKALVTSLPNRVAPWEPEAELMYTLLIDMGAGLALHGETLDETATSLPDPAEALSGYVQMYREYFEACGDQDRVRTDDEMAYGAKLAWRVWQQAQRSNTRLEDLLAVLWGTR